MKIVFIDSTIHEPAIGGAQIFLPALLNGLSDQDHEVYLITGGVPNPVLAPAFHNSRIRIQNGLWKDWSLPEDKAKRLADWLNQLHPDIYVISVSADVGWLCLPMLLPSIRTLAIAHSNMDSFYLPAAHYKAFLSGVIGVSDEICSKYESVSRISPERIQWIPYGVRAATSLLGSSTSRPLRLIYVGRLEEEYKRISDLVKLAKQLSQSAISFTLRIIGDGSRREWMESELATEVAKGYVQFSGWLKHESVPEQLKEAEIFILTSDSEGFSIALTEAMANGCCPIVTDIPSGSIQLIKDGVNGFLLPVGDIPGFLARISELAADRNKLQALRESAWETGRQYSTGKMIDRYSSWFEKIIQQVSVNDREPVSDYPVMRSCRSKYPNSLRRAGLRLRQLIRKFKLL